VLDIFNNPDDIGSFDGIIFDISVSSYQFDSSHRGFSFRNNGVLDMRMDQSQNTISAYEIVCF